MKALILGLGESGLAIALWLAREGAVLRVADTRTEPPMLAALRAELPDAQFAAGAFEEALLDGVGLVAISPGLSPTHSEAKVIVAAAKKRGVEVVGEIELFARALAKLKSERGYAPHVVGVTGTNGKTTTTRLAGLLVERAGRDVAVAGNISPTALDVLRERLDADRLPDVWVLELSSFQLATTTSLACDAAAVLNVTQDHLDWHGTLEAYAKAKARIFAKDTVQVLNRDDPLVLAMARGKSHPVTFGAGAPAQPDEYGLVRDGGLTWLAYAEDQSQGQRRRKAATELPGIPGEVFVHRLMPADALRIRGRHNALNALAALALARAIGCPLAPMLHALREYEGEPHRVELIASIAGVEYYDDSKGTNVGATVAALEGLGAEKADAGRRLVVILGGDGKGQDFAPLVAPLAAHARAVVLIGRDGPRIGELLRGASYPVESCATLTDAVRACMHHARPGDAVLLSPACASLDMFRNYAHRADVFKESVRELAAEAGQPC
ncbi:MAG: UDP-N-acetylmuramoylalanine--D-glutamate ligase [Betaproteobacteria bacterium]|nr:MAG: UDP-N-acetylmuramoylalanine--D-glutamate ligase [Betaproteobacteria bacterium]